MHSEKDYKDLYCDILEVLREYAFTTSEFDDDSVCDNCPYIEENRREEEDIGYNYFTCNLNPMSKKCMNSEAKEIITQAIQTREIAKKVIGDFINAVKSQLN